MINNGFATKGYYVRRGHYNLKLGNTENAIKDFTEANNIDPDDNEVLIQRAHAFYRSNQFEKAIDDLTQIINSQREPTSFLEAVYHWRGLSYYKLKKNVEALNDFNWIMGILQKEKFSEASDYVSVFSPENIS